jgi:hypothetical protein
MVRERDAREACNWITRLLVASHQVSIRVIHQQASSVKLCTKTSTVPFSHPAVLKVHGLGIEPGSEQARILNSPCVQHVAEWAYLRTSPPFADCCCGLPLPESEAERCVGWVQGVPGHLQVRG